MNSYHYSSLYSFSNRESSFIKLQVDVKDPHHELKQLTKICILADLTLMLAWSPEEAGRIIEVYKIYEHKPPDMIMEKQDSNPYSMVCNIDKHDMPFLIFYKYHNVTWHLCAHGQGGQCLVNSLRLLVCLLKLINGFSQANVMS